jgi:hypothetical protein
MRFAAGLPSVCARPLLADSFSPPARGSGAPTPAANKAPVRAYPSRATGEGASELTPHTTTASDCTVQRAGGESCVAAVSGRRQCGRAAGGEFGLPGEAHRDDLPDRGEVAACHEMGGACSQAGDHPRLGTFWV